MKMNNYFKTGLIPEEIILTLAGLSSIGLMAVINFLIDSDFKWMLLFFTIPWTLTLASYFRSDFKSAD